MVNLSIIILLVLPLQSHQSIHHRRSLTLFEWVLAINVIRERRPREDSVVLEWFDCFFRCGCVCFSRSQTKKMDLRNDILCRKCTASYRDFAGMVILETV